MLLLEFLNEGIEGKCRHCRFLVPKGNLDHIGFLHVFHFQVFLKTQHRHIERFDPFRLLHFCQVRIYVLNLHAGNYSLHEIPIGQYLDFRVDDLFLTEVEIHRIVFPQVRSVQMFAADLHQDTGLCLIGRRHQKGPDKCGQHHCHEYRHNLCFVLEHYRQEVPGAAVVRCAKFWFHHGIFDHT